MTPLSAISSGEIANLVSTIADDWFAGLFGRQADLTYSELERGFARILGTSCRLLIYDEERSALRFPAGRECWTWEQLGASKTPNLFSNPKPTDPEALGSPESAASLFLRLALLDRKENCLGVILARIGSPLTNERMLALGELTKKAAIVLDNLRTQEIVRGLLGAVRDCKAVSEVVPIALKYAYRMVRANRGEVAYFDWDQDAFVFDVLSPAPDEPAGTRGVLVPEKSLVRRIWNTSTEEARLVREVDSEVDYSRCHEQTRSELLIRLNQKLGPDWPMRRIGVLNLESFEELPHRRFDDQDKHNLELLIQTALEGSLEGEPDIDFPGVIARFTRSQDYEGTANALLRQMRDSYGFDRGILYRPDHARNELVVFGYLGPTKTDHSGRGFRYKFDEKAAATWVFASKKVLFSPEPWNDDRVNPRGIKDFEIETSLLALPLLANNECVGVLVVWTTKSRNPEVKHLVKNEALDLIFDEQHLLRKFTNMAALVLQAEDQREREAEKTRRQIDFDKGSQAILDQMQSTLDLKKNLDLILDCVHRVGFDRVRVFEFRYGDTMVPKDSRGMGEFHASFMTCIQGLDHPFANHLITNARLMVGSNLVAREYPSLDVPDDDPHSKALDKQPPEMHWISVPLVSAGRLYGEIAVDNRHSRRKFDLDDFEHMTVFAALAARAFAIDEKRGMLPARPLTLLAEKVGFNKPEHHVLSCLLRFLTHWEGGLGFSRSLFFEWERGYGSYCFRLGVGQITQERWNEVVPKVRMLTLAEVLDETSIPCDPELNTTMRDCRIDGADIAQKKGVWDEMATTRLQVAGRAIDAETILCCKLEGPEEPLGLIVVDRRYQDGREQFWDADKAMLETFAHEATHILLLHRLHRAAIELQHNSHFGMIAKGIPHEFRSLLLEAKGAAYDIEEALGSSMTEPIREDLEILSQKLTRMSTTVTRFTEVLTGKKIATQLTDLVWEVCQEQRASLSAAGIRLEVVMEPVPPVDAFAGILRTALENLLRNSAQVLTVWSGIKMIEVGVHPKGHGIEVSVRDTGPGLRASIEQEFNRSGFGATSRPGEGLGVGLLIARWVAFLHGGAFDIQSTQPQGTRATLSIPTI